MRIWILNHYALPPDRVGGTRHFDLATQLARKGHEVTIFSSDFDHFTRFPLRNLERKKWKAEEIDGVEFVWLHTRPYRGNGIGRMINILSYTWRALRVGWKWQRPDVVLGSSVHLFAPLAGWLLSKRHRVPFNLEVRDLWPLTLVELGVMSPWHPFVQINGLLERFLYRRASAIITLLPRSIDYIGEIAGRRNHIHYVPNGVDLHRFDRLTDYPIRLLGEKINGFKLLYLGSMSFSDGLDVWLEAAKLIQEQNANIDVFFVGEGTHRKWLEEEARRMELKGLHFLPPIPKTQVPAVVREADALIINLRNMPRLYRFGISMNKIFDYMASGLPIVVSGHAEGNPVEEAGAGICVPSGSPADLMKAVMHLRSMSAEERAAIGARGRRYVEEHHSTEHLADLLLQAISSNGSLPQ